VAGLTLLLGVDRFMSEMRALTNLVGNGVATIVVAKWERELNEGTMVRVLNGGGPDDDTLLGHAAAIEPVPFVDHPPVSVRSGADH
jgi:aerobic C4-dicarboxylate transport protein